MSIVCVQVRFTHDTWRDGVQRIVDERKPAHTSPSESAGILKADWFQKHRQRRPAVAALFLNWCASRLHSGEATALPVCAVSQPI